MLYLRVTRERDFIQKDPQSPQVEREKNYMEKKNIINTLAEYKS